MEDGSFLNAPPIHTQGRIVLACVLLHNLLWKYIPTDDHVNFEEEDDQEFAGDDDSDDEVEYVTHAETSYAWMTFRSSLAQMLFNNWRARSRGIDNVVKLFVLNSCCILFEPMIY